MMKFSAAMQTITVRIARYFGRLSGASRMSLRWQEPYNGPINRRIDGPVSGNPTLKESI
jgi:hypothetical protein